MWEEYIADFNTVFSTNISYENLLSDAAIRARNDNEVLVIKSIDNQIISWDITEL